MIDALSSGRPAGDVLSRIVRITLAGQDYQLPVRSIRFNREWKAQLDARTTGVVDALVDAGDDWEKVLAQLEEDVDPFVDLLVSYAPNVLSREAIEDIEPDPSMDVIRACREVWLAASPLVAIGVAELLQTMTEVQANDSSQPTSSPPPSTDGRPTSLTNGSPTSSSSPTSTQPVTESPTTTGIATKPRSRRSASERSSPTTTRRTNAGRAARPSRATKAAD